MRRKTFCTILLALVGGILNTFAYTTAGNGTTYSLSTLSQTDGSDVLRFDDGDEIIYMIMGTVTIAKGDRFVMDDGVTVQFDDNASLVIEGEADFRLTKGSTFDSAFDGGGDVRPVGQMAARLKECLRLGYTDVIVPEGTKTDLPGLKLISVRNVLEASSLIAYPAE